MTLLYLIRGLPGSGKTTKAYELMRLGFISNYFEADMFFINKDGEYKFNPKQLGEAHRWCLLSTYGELLKGNSIAVANTFTTKKEMQPYLDLGFPVEIIKCTGEYGSVHNVPEKALEKMRRRFYRGVL